MQKTDPIDALLLQSLRTALALIDALEAQVVKKSAHYPYERYAPGVYASRSKHNPYRAYAAVNGRSLYLGLFPSIAEAQAAQRACHQGKQPENGTRVANGRAPLALIKQAVA